MVSEKREPGVNIPLVIVAALALAAGGLESRFAFRHALYRQMFYQRLAGMRRVSLHRAVAAALLRRGVVPAAELAEHFEQGQDLPAALRQLASADASQIVLVRGDKAVPYGRIIEIMGQINAAGFSKVSLIAQAPSGSSAP